MLLTYLKLSRGLSSFYDVQAMRNKCKAWLLQELALFGGAQPAVAGRTVQLQQRVFYSKPVSCLAFSMFPQGP